MRPKKDAADKLTHSITLRFNDRYARVIENYCSDHDVNPTALARQALREFLIKHGYLITKANMPDPLDLVNPAKLLAPEETTRKRKRA